VTQTENMGDVLVVLYICIVAFVVGAYMVYKSEDMGARKFGGILVGCALIGIFFSYYHINIQEKNMGDIYSNNYAGGQVYFPKAANSN
jgi:hypothetical protein